MMTLVHNDHGIEKPDDLNQGRLIGIGQQHGRVVHPLGELRQIAVFLVRLAPVLFTGTEGIVAQHKDGELLRHRRGGEILAHQRLLFGVNLDPSAEVHLQPLTVGMVRIFQRLAGLGQNGLGGYQPHHGFGPALGHGVENRPQRAGGDVGLSAAGGHLGANLWNPGQGTAIGRHSVEPH